MPAVIDPKHVPQGKVKPTYDQLVEQNKRLEQEYKALLEENVRIKANIEPVYELVNQVTAHLVLAQIVKD